MQGGQGHGCKAFDIMEICLVDRRMPPEDLVANTLLIAVHHCLTPALP
jgi:hypothetical protein